MALWAAKRGEDAVNMRSTFAVPSPRLQRSGNLAQILTRHGNPGFALDRLYARSRTSFVCAAERARTPKTGL